MSNHPYLVDIRRGDEVTRVLADSEAQIAELIRPRKGAAALEYCRVERIQTAPVARAARR